MNRYSTFWRRVSAAVVDGIVLTPLDWLSAAVLRTAASEVTEACWYLAESILILGYSIWMHARFGQTVGKMVCGVVVMDASEMDLLSFRQATLREAGLIALYGLTLVYIFANIAFELGGPAEERMGLIFGYAALGWLVVEVITMLTNEKRRALHDWIAHSVVVRKNA